MDTRWRLRRAAVESEARWTLSRVEGCLTDVLNVFPTQYSNPVTSYWRILQEAADDDAVAKLARMRGSWRVGDGWVMKRTCLGTCLSVPVTVEGAVRSQWLVEADD